MDKLFERSLVRINLTPDTFTRSMMGVVNWNARLIGIRGARGVGKTTLLLQYLKQNAGPGQALYISLDDILFSGYRLIEVADRFAKLGGKFLFLDEVHKYPDWSQEVKNIYDNYPELKIAFTGSSLLEILNSRADLSRRAVTYTMPGLSYREYLNLKLGLQLPSVTLAELPKNHNSFSEHIVKTVKPLQYFGEYLQKGYYPFFMEDELTYSLRLEEIVKMVIEIELPELRGVEAAWIYKMRQLLGIIAQSVPFVPNLTKLSERIGINRNTLIAYLNYLSEAAITRNLYKDAAGITQLQKPDKIFLENTNLMFALSNRVPEKGNVRETFFVNQLSHLHTLEYAPEGDFTVDGTYTFEIGGSKKNRRQISGVNNSYVAADDIEFGHLNKIPLWMMGFLY